MRTEDKQGPGKKAEPVTEWHFSTSNELSLHISSNSILQEVFYSILFVIITSSNINYKFTS